MSDRHVPASPASSPPLSLAPSDARRAVDSPPPPPPQVVRVATMVLDVPPAEAFPWFGPLAERAWAGPDWQPRFVHPLPPADVEGAVFLTPAHGVPGETTWVNVRFDAAAGVAEYVHYTAGLLVTRITVTVTADDRGGSLVRVRYAWTPLSADGAASFTGRAERFPEWIAEWQAALAPVLAAARGADRG